MIPPAEVVAGLHPCGVTVIDDDQTGLVGAALIVEGAKNTLGAARLERQLDYADEGVQAETSDTQAQRQRSRSRRSFSFAVSCLETSFSVHT